MNQNQRIMWVDDDIELLHPQMRQLKDYGYYIDIEPDIDTALHVLESEAQTLKGVILDVMMNPGKKLRDRAHQGGLTTGVVVIDYLSTAGILNSTKLFILTHRYCPESLEAAQKLGVQYYHKQDYKGSEICVLVKQMFGEPL